MHKLYPRLWCAVGGVLAAWLGLASPTLAQIRVGQTAGLSGAVAATVKEATAGARLVFDQVNAKGGIQGQKIELVQMDDRFEPAEAAANARKLADSGVIALFLTRGTPHNQAILPVLDAAKLPLVGPSTGAMLLHQPVIPWVFNVRASYQREAERVVRHLLQTGVTRLAIVQVADSFGEDAAAGALHGFTGGKAPAAHLKYDRSKPDFAPIVQKVVAVEAQSVLFIGSGTAVVDGIKALRAAGSSAQLATLSNNASSGFVKALGPLAHGVIVSQVLPSERALAVPLVKEAHDLLGQHPAMAAEVTPALLEGVVSAKVLVEGLRRAAAAHDLTRNGLVQALNGLQKLNLGGLEISYSPTDHSGLDYADLSIVGGDGRFKR